MTSGYHFKPSSGSLWVRPRWNSPPGMNIRPGSAAHAAAARTRLAIQGRNLIRGNIPVRSERVDVGIGAPRGRVADLLAPVDPECRIHGRKDIFHARLIFAEPARLDAFLTGRIGTAQDAARLYSRSGDQCRVTAVVMIAAGHVVQGAGRAAEFA